MAPPSIVAFSVMPTSGGGPYTYTIDIANRFYLDAGAYTLRYYEIEAVGSCLPDALAGTARGTVSQQLLNSGTASLGLTVPLGSCRTSTVVIRDAITNVIVSQASVYISNL